MTTDEQKYEAVIGLEVHAQLLTKTKLFCGDETVFGRKANTQVSPITLAHPGVLPKLNKQAIEHAVKLGIACNCTIEKENYFARKNYFYPDLPKGYQISQHTTPICKGGFIKINTREGERNIQLNRIHIEEDAGKSLHDEHEPVSLIDLNRAGVALLEIVTEPDLHSGEEAFAYLTALRKMVRWLNVCDGNMEEGSMRCDANISIRLKGEKILGTKVEIKNLNSIRNVKRAIEAEVKRLIQLKENNAQILQETRGFDAASGNTFTIRVKEDANDYRYFADPDLTPFVLSDSFIEGIKNNMPVMPESYIEKYVLTFGLSEYDAHVICDDKETTEFFETLIKHTHHYKAAANWLIGPVKSYLNEKETSFEKLSLKPEILAELIEIVEQGKMNFSSAAHLLLPKLFEQKNKKALELAQELNLLQDAGDDIISHTVDAILNNMPDKVKEYKQGKKGLIALFTGQAIKQLKGKADPKKVNEMLLKKLNA